MVPRWNLGTWSATVATNGARVMLAPSCASAQPTVAIIRLGASAMIAKATVIRMVPSTIQMRRRPQVSRAIP